jgi:pimeloyl-ACP methyl ester carboxylesterase
MAVTMNWQPFYFSFPEARLALQEKGQGNHVLLCLHGYRQAKEMFHAFFEKVPEGWKIVLMDLPLSGETEWLDPRRGITQGFLKRFWQKLRERYPEGRFHLLGFSMGGWVAMALQLTVEPIAESIFLLAPDGIRSNFWYRVAQTPVGRGMIEWALKNHRFIMQMNERLYSLNRKNQILEPYEYRFIKRNFSQESLRKLLHQQLTLYAPLRFSRRKLVQKARNQDAEWHLIWGKGDQILPSEIAFRLKIKAPSVKVHLIEAGHLLLSDNPYAVKKILDEYLFWE